MGNKTTAPQIHPRATLDPPEMICSVIFFLSGTFRSQVGETQCEVCPEGQSSDNGSRTCQPATLLECVVRDCPADLTGDGFVGTDDLLSLLAVFGRVDCAYEIVIGANPGRIDTEDLLALLQAFGRAC